MVLLRAYAPIFCALLSPSGLLLADETKLNSFKKNPLEEVYVWGESRETSDAGYVSPTSVLTQEDILAINAVTTEDLVKFEPSLVIRRRFIGDSNGTLGVRGSNMFQTSRSMVFADGVPLHYFLQSRWSGAPRWTMVSASEIAQVEVIYGPFSAEYSGNAMGGVVLIETAIPQKREIHIDGSYFSQAFEAYGFDDNVDGFKGFASYGDKIGDASIYLSYNYLDNTAQPQSFRDSSPSLPENEIVTGSIVGKDSTGNTQLWYGDTGVVETTTENFKLKLGYDFGDWQSLFNLAYEDRHSANIGNSYIKDSSGNTLWAGDGLTEHGQSFSIQSSRLNASELNRQSLSLGARLKGTINKKIRLEANVNRFEILKDEALSSLLNPNAANYTPEGQINDYDNSGWSTAEVKLITQDISAAKVELITGIRYEAYTLNLDVYQSPDYAAAIKGAHKSRFGGETQMSAVFAQANWTISTQWDTAFGLRYESFKSRNGYYSDDDATTAALDLVRIPSETKTAVSPKFSLGYRPEEAWLVRYSLAKAYRFPIVEELFSQYEDYNSQNLSNPKLQPEAGLHHNLMFDKTITGGYLRVNVFHERVKQAIESQVSLSSLVRTFVPIDEVEVKGLEFIVNKSGLLVSGLDVRFNLAWTNATIIDNSSADESIEGNTYPRMPKWRSNLLATYHLNPDWNLSASIQYASDSYGSLDNADMQDNVFGAQDDYTRIGLKSAYQINDQWRVSVGLDNLTNDIAYVAHPWPGRTAYFNFSLNL